MKRCFVIICIFLFLFNYVSVSASSLSDEGGYSEDLYEYEKELNEEDQKIEDEWSQEDRELQRFIGINRDCVWQVYCTTMYEWWEKDAKKYFSEEYINAGNSYDLHISVTAIMVSDYNKGEKGTERRWERKMLGGFIDKDAGRKTEYYKIQQALKYYVVSMKEIGQPVYFEYEDWQQEQIDQHAKEGDIPEYYLKNSYLFQDGTCIPEEVTIEPTEEVTEKEKVDDTLSGHGQSKEKNIDKKENNVISFFLGGGFTLVLTAVAGVVYFVVNKKRKRSEFE